MTVDLAQTCLIIRQVWMSIFFAFKSKAYTKHNCNSAFCHNTAPALMTAAEQTHHRVLTKRI